MKNVLFIHGEKNQLHSIREVLKSNGYTDFRFILCRDMQDVQKILRDYDINCIFYEIVNSRFLRELEYLRKIARDLPKIVCGERLGKKELVGIINAGSIFHYLEKPFKEQDFVDAIKDSVAFNEGIKEKYIENQKVYFQQQVEKLNNIGIALSSEHKLEKLLDRIVSQSLFLAYCDAGSIYTVDGSMLSFNVARNNTLKKRYGNGYEDKCFKRYRIPINMDRISGYVAATGETLNIKDVYRIGPDKKYTFTDDFDRRNNYKTQSMITAPLKDSEGNILGV
ncbi:MAG: GAF domain-containing protein, partial [Spirochaetes bacterium]|nr:GAF domain-containing protein [Spirochaetota bacterium]